MFSVPFSSTCLILLERDRLAGLCDAACDAAAATRALLAPMSTRNRPADLVERFDLENDEVARLGQLWLDTTARIERWRAEIERSY